MLVKIVKLVVALLLLTLNISLYTAAYKEMGPEFGVPLYIVAITISIFTLVIFISMFAIGKISQWINA